MSDDFDIELDVDDLLSQIEDAAEEVGDVAQIDFNQLAAEVYASLRNGRFKNRTGALRRSMVVGVVNDNTLRIRMLAYGYYLSFGVKGREASRSTFGLPAEVALAFGVREGYNFGPSQWGINARNFYPRGLVDRIVEVINDKIEQL